jgi:hypothetical protein
MIIIEHKQPDENLVAHNGYQRPGGEIRFRKARPSFWLLRDMMLVFSNDVITSHLDQRTHHSLPTRGKSCRLCTTSGLSAAAALLMRHGQVCRLCVDGSPLWSVPHRCYRAPSREQFNFRWRLPQVIGSPGLGVLSAGLSSAMSSDASYLVARRLYKRALNPTDLSGSYGTL